MSLTIGLKRLHPAAVLPTPAHQYGDAGFDLYAVEQTEIPQGTCKLVSTGLQLADCPLEDGAGNQWFLDIRSRSGLAKKMVFPITGTVDVSYRGEIFVLLANLGQAPAVINPGDRVAQVVVQKIIANTPRTSVVFRETDKVVETPRGAGGFGSTGA